MPLQDLIAMALALGAGGLVKGATGMGLPVIALPILATFLGVPQAVTIMAVVGFFTNAWQTWRFRADLWSVDFLPGLLVAGAFGVVLGTWLLTALPERSLQMVLALFLLGYVALRLFSPDFALSRRTGRRLAPAAGVSAGLLQGAAGISSPIGVTFIHAMRLGRSAHVFAVSAMFLSFSAVQVPALAVAGVLTWPLLLQSLLALGPALAAMPLGSWLGRHLSQRTFDRLILLFLSVVALQLVAKALGW